jgi:hypothetical protein
MKKIVMKFWLFNINRIIFFSAAAVNFLFSCRGVQTVLVTVITIGSRADVSVITLTPKQLCTYHQQARRGTTTQDDVVDAKHATQPMQPGDYMHARRCMQGNPKSYHY